MYSAPLITYEYLRLTLSKEERIFKNLLKNSAFNILIIGTVYGLGSCFVSYKPKEEISAIYEKKFQKELIKKTREDVMGNLKDKKRINLFPDNEKKI